MVKVGDQIIAILDADRQPEQATFEPGSPALLAWARGVWGLRSGGTAVVGAAAVCEAVEVEGILGGGRSPRWPAAGRCEAAHTGRGRPWEAVSGRVRPCQAVSAVSAVSGRVRPCEAYALYIRGN